jgi:hypothetical protein
VLPGNSTTSERDLEAALLVVGTGTRLFPEGVTPTGLRLTHSQTTENGVPILSYEHACKPAYGTVGVDV